MYKKSKIFKTIKCDNMKRFLFGFILISIFLFVVYEAYQFLNTPTYHIRFNSNGGSKVESILIKENNSLEKLPTPTKENYKFVGWYLNDTPFDLSLEINQDYTLNAIWQELATNTYTISFDTLGGNIIEPLTLKENEVLEELPLPEKEGYKFENWLYQNKIITSLTATRNMTLVAKYQKQNNE